jgi:hypothetical protein
MLEELEDITPIGVVSLTLPAKTKVGAAGLKQGGSPIIKADVSDKIEEDEYDEEDYEEEDEEYDDEE